MATKTSSQMKLELVNRVTPENAVSVRIRGSNDVSIYANAIRRVLLEEIPYVGFDAMNRANSNFKKNTTLFTDEFLRLRLAMIPLSLSRGEIERVSTAEYRWVNGVTPIFELETKHTTSVPKIRAVYSDEMKAKLAGHIVKPGAKEDSLGIGYDTVSKEYPILAKLRTNDELSIHGVVQIGTGRTHAGFSPIGGIGYERRHDGKDIILHVDANNALNPTAIQHVNDALYWAQRYLHDFCRELNDTPVMIDPTNSTVTFTFKNGNETRAGVIISEVRKILGDRGFASHRSPHPLIPTKEYILRPPNKKMKSEQKLKEWSMRLLHKAAKEAISNFDGLRKNLMETNSQRDWSPTIADGLAR